MGANKSLSLRDLTRASGCTPRTVRYYERQGLLRARRSPGGHRMFAASEVERLEFIISLREAGWSLEEIQGLLDLRRTADDDRSGIERLSEIVNDHIDRLGRKLEVLQALRADLVATRTLLPVCLACTEREDDAPCASCERVPELPTLPRTFRLTWRAGELDAGPFDEQDARDIEEDVDER